jgi:hypothetical protein
VVSEAFKESLMRQELAIYRAAARELSEWLAAAKRDGV